MKKVKGHVMKRECNGKKRTENHSFPLIFVVSVVKYIKKKKNAKESVYVYVFLNKIPQKVVELLV